MSDLTRVSTFEPFIKAILDSSQSSETKRKYGLAIRDFITWYRDAGFTGLTRVSVQAHITYLQESGIGSINQRLAAIKKLAYEAYSNQAISHEIWASIKSIPGIKQTGTKTGNWLDKRQANALLRKPDLGTLKGLRDRAILAIFLGAGLRRSEAASLTFEHIQQRDGRWVIVDMFGNGNKTRTVPIASWVWQSIYAWSESSGLKDGIVFRSMNKGGKITGERMSAQALRNVTVMYSGLPPHDLRRTMAKLAHRGGAEISQISLSLGHSSIQTTQRYLGIELDLHNAPSDNVGLRLG